MDTANIRMKETIFTRHRSTVEPMMAANDRKATLWAIHTSADNQAINRQEVVNVVLDDRPPLIDNNEKDLTRKELSTLAQLRSGHCKPLGSYKSRIYKDASLNLCTNCGRTSHDVNHLFKCPAHPMTVTPLDLWSRPVDAIRELRYLEAGEPYSNANNNNNNQIV